jgi:hypothetical protein
MEVIPQKKKAANAAFILIPIRQLSSCRFSASLVFVVELLNTACRIYNFLGTCIERMALGADFNVQSRFAQGGTGCELVATAASNCNVGVCGMDVCSHFCS